VGLDYMYMVNLDRLEVLKESKKRRYGSLCQSVYPQKTSGDNPRKLVWNNIQMTGVGKPGRRGQRIKSDLSRGCAGEDSSTSPLRNRVLHWLSEMGLGGEGKGPGLSEEAGVRN